MSHATGQHAEEQHHTSRVCYLDVRQACPHEGGVVSTGTSEDTVSQTGVSLTRRPDQAPAG